MYEFAVRGLAQMLEHVNEQMQASLASKESQLQEASNKIAVTEARLHAANSELSVQRTQTAELQRVAEQLSAANAELQSSLQQAYTDTDDLSGRVGNLQVCNKGSKHRECRC